MRILVTGGAGFIGSGFVHLTRRERQDVELTVLDALTYAGSLRSLDGVRDEIRFVEGDVRDAELVDRLVADSDAVVHFAAESHNDRSLAHPEPFVSTNVVGTFTLLEAVRRHDVRYHHISTDEVFGELALEDPDRFTPGRAYAPSSPYSATKGAADLLVGAWARSYRIAATISCSSNNYGPRQHVEKLIPRQITTILDGGRPRLYGDGRHVRDWIHVDDHNRAVWAILDRGRIGQTYLIGADGEADNRTVVETILELMGRDRGEIDLVTDRPGHDRRYAIDAAVLRTELGWQPQVASFRDGLAETIQWYRTHESWWRPLKAATEAQYARTERLLDGEAR
jgi:dTDP-glucose 4,6-dehydratase